ncbi:MAG: hypothetical protein SVY10_08615 [Thermodesulfobacteriota bacterium]|nr:hypothetical protein [Thermodesulfobacteriota bacterium]
MKILSVVGEEIKKFAWYLIGKKSEVKDLNHKDVLLAKTILDIHRKRIRSEFIFVPLFSLNPIHPINRESSLKTTAQRTEELIKHKSELIKEKNISREFLAAYMPSISWIKAVKEDDDSYITYEGNGRLAAMHQVFEPEDNMSVEIEVYHFKNNEKIIRRMNRVRRVNGLIP